MAGSPSARQFGLRRAKASDAGAIAHLGATVFATTFGHSCTPEQLASYLEEAYSLASVEADLANPDKDTIVAVAQDTDEVVGFALLTRGSSEPCVEHLDDAVELQRLYVGLQHHGSGLGGRLQRETEAMARDQGFGHMWLGVWEENHKAIKVYEKLGFTMVGSHDFDIGGDIQTDHIMLKKL